MPESTYSRLKGLSGARGWLAIDETLTHKTGKKIEGVCIFWDHGEKRAVLAHNVVTAEFVNPKGDSHLLDFQSVSQKRAEAGETSSFQD
jgi:hypothetical protein